VGSARQGQRSPNRLGEGERLRQEILDAATRILEESGSEGALSLRGIAREVGITAPSIYLHFKDRTELVWEVLGTAYTDLATRMRHAQDTAPAEPWQQLRATADVYRQYALANPRRYRLMFSLEGQAPVGPDRAAGHPLSQVIDAWAEAVDRYLATVTPGRRPEAHKLAVLLWTGMHGQLVLYHTLPTTSAADEPELAKLNEYLMEKLLLQSPK
jgi:AcrR family transcriptional regulator